jgi:2'-5' RNA ligase
MRLFIAIPLAHAVIEELSQISHRLRSDADGLRWASPDSWHITLQFLGETSGEQYGCIVPRLHVLESPVAPISLQGLDIFDRAGVFFAGVIVSPELLTLQHLVNAATAPCGFIPESRPFHPHVTLARAKGDRREQTLRRLMTKIDRQREFGNFMAREFLLYESHLGPRGSRYEVRERFALQS